MPQRDDYTYVAEIGGPMMVKLDAAIEIVEMCVLAGKPERTAGYLRDMLLPAEVRQRLAAETPPTSTSARSQQTATQAARSSSSTLTIDDKLAQAIARRFAAQNPDGAAKA